MGPAGSLHSGEARSEAALARARERLRALSRSGVSARVGSSRSCLVRRAETLVIVPERSETVVFNYANNQVVEYTGVVARLLNSANQWVALEKLVPRGGGR